MSKNIIEVNSKALTTDAKELEKIEKQAEKILKQVYALISEIDAMWDGPANDTFKTKFYQDYAVFADILKFVHDFSDKMDKASTKYSQCEDALYSLVSSMKI